MALATRERAAMSHRAGLAGGTVILMLLGAGLARADFDGALERLERGDFARALPELERLARDLGAREAPTPGVAPAAAAPPRVGVADDRTPLADDLVQCVVESGREPHQ